jgi:16S rRNA C967 or C1407 C5-methylase (RsmB/RsmF family)
LRLDAAERIGERWWYLAGLCHAQEEASMFPVRLLAPRPGERVLDLCAAPGGKSVPIAMASGSREL